MATSQRGKAGKNIGLANFIPVGGESEIHTMINVETAVWWVTTKKEDRDSEEWSSVI